MTIRFFMLAKRTMIWIAVGEVLLLVLIAALFLVLRTRQSAGHADRPDVSDWGVAAGRTSLFREFAWRGNVTNALDAADRFRFRMSGQKHMFELWGDSRGVSAWLSDSGEEHRVLAETQWPAPPRAGDQLLTVKSPDAVELYLNGTRLLHVPCPVETWQSCVWQLSNMTMPFASFSYQKIGALIFLDDFMHDEGELGAWQPLSGDWTVHALRNPVRSANAFSFLGKGDDAGAVAGHWFWRNYRFDVAVHPLPGSEFGVCSYYIDPDNHYRVRWAPAPAGRPAFQLIRVANGETTVLGTKHRACLPNTWTQLSVAHLHDSITLAVDGLPVLEVIDPEPLPAGKVVLWTNGDNGVVFDDVAVTSAQDFAWNAGQAGGRPSVLLRAVAAPIAVEDHTGGDAARTIQTRGVDVGGIVRENAAIEATVDGLAALDSLLELRSRQNASGDYIGFRLSRRPHDIVAELFVRWDGREIWIERTPLQRMPGRARLSLHTHGDTAWCKLDGRLVCFAGGIPGIGPGTCGVRVPQAAADVTIERVAVRAEHALPAIENRVETFTREESMQNWNSPVMEWTARYSRSGATHWHRTDYWQDVSATIRRDKLDDADLATPWGLMLSADDSGQAPEAVLRVTPKSDKQTLELSLGPTNSRRLDLMRPVESLSLERRSNRLLVRLNGALVWNESLPDGLQTLCRIGRFGRGGLEDWAQAVQIRAAGVRTYSFKRAPAEWLATAGTWEVTNRWQCDPRWSFFSGVQRNGVACNWNKRRHGKNVTLEFFAGPKMDAARGKRYDYAADINAVIAGDGRNITSGYSFLFGGWNDTGSYVTRGNRVLAENRAAPIPRSAAIHRRWFHIKVRKHGSRLTFWVDGERVATAVDPAPATGDRFGLWTWDNGIMVAQVRVCTDTDLAAAPPVIQPAKGPQTPYDVIAGKVR